MTLEELYPYWAGVHDELLGRMATLTEAELNFKPIGGTPSIRQMTLEFLQTERDWIAGLVAGFLVETVRAGQYPTGRELAEALAAQREVTARALSPLSPVGMRSVRTVPADPLANRPEANAPISWLFWHLMESEIVLWGRVRLRLEEERAARRYADG